jgi:hypothetical protein
VSSPTAHDPVQPGTARWAELVRGAIDREASRNWYLGDAALEIAPMAAGSDTQVSDQPYHNGASAALRQYADEIGAEYNTLLAYRRVAAAWPDANRLASTSWKVHQILASRPELIQPGMTISEAAKAAGQRNVGRTGPQSPPEDRAAAAADYLADPEVARQAMAAMDPQARAGLARDILADPDAADQVMTDPDTREEAFRAAMRVHERENLNRPRPASRPRDLRDDLDEHHQTELAWADVQDALAREARHLQRSELLRRDKEFAGIVLGYLTETRNRLDLIESIVAGGGVTDEALTDLLNGGGQ